MDLDDLLTGIAMVCGIVVFVGIALLLAAAVLYVPLGLILGHAPSEAFVFLIGAIAVGLLLFFFDV